MSSDQDQDQIHRADVVTESFTISDLHRVRGLVERASQTVGLAPSSTVDLVVAVTKSWSTPLYMRVAAGR
jgi:hypothetical protein